MKITNPVLTGFHADPSMIRVRDTYYIANSTFEWFPGTACTSPKTWCIGTRCRTPWAPNSLTCATMRLKPETARTIWMGDDVKLVEGPHLYKINGWYYLFCAEGVYEYSRHARSILHTCVHRGEDGEGYPMWNPENHLIKFIPETE